MESMGWRNALAVMSLGVWLVSIPAWLLLFRPGSRYAARIAVPTDHQPRGSLVAHFRDIARHRNFWLIAISIFLVAGVDQGMTQNAALFLELDKGMNIRNVAWAASLFAAVGLVSKIIWGWVYDKMSIRGIQLTYLMLVVAILLEFADHQLVRAGRRAPVDCPRIVAGAKLPDPVKFVFKHSAARGLPLDKFRCREQFTFPVRCQSADRRMHNNLVGDREHSASFANTERKT